MTTRPQIQINLTETDAFETMVYDMRTLFQIINDIETEIEFETTARIDKDCLTDILTDGRLEVVKNHYNDVMEN
jgi:hypothetical protein